MTQRKVPARWAHHYERLCAERDKLLERECPTAEGSQPKLDDLTDAASQESQRSLSLVTATATYDAIKEVLAAIRRIERGTYGICEITGEPIAAERLESLPWARYSFEGQRQLEREGLARKAALPSLEGVAKSDDDEMSEEEESE